MYFKKDIGSIFPIYEKENLVLDTSNNIEADKKRINVSLAREAILLTAIIKPRNKKVMIPAYTCHTCIDPYIQEGFEIFYYGITKDLKIDTNSFLDIFKRETPGIIFISPYYGMNFSEKELELISKASKQGAFIVMDLTQNIFQKRDYEFVDAYIGSSRKWFAIPDGGFIEFKNKKYSEIAKKILQDSKEFLEFSSNYLQAMKLRGEYFLIHDENIKTTSRGLYQKSTEIADEKIKIHKMSSYSLKKINDFSEKKNIEKRFQNFMFLDQNIKFNSLLRRVYRDEDIKRLHSPLYYPIYCSDRKKVQQALIQEKVYAPILWEVTEDKQLINKEIEFIFKSLLCIPIAQIYGKDEMKRIINVLNNLKECEEI